MTAHTRLVEMVLADRDSLIRQDHHIATDHGGDTPFKCSVCDDAFALKFQLDDHNLRAHNIGFMCEQCSKIFPKKRSLEMHVAQVCTNPLIPNGYFHSDSICCLYERTRTFQSILLCSGSYGGLRIGEERGL